MFLFGINRELRERAASQAEVEDGASSGPWGIWDTYTAGLPRVLKLTGAAELQQGWLWRGTPTSPTTVMSSDMLHITDEPIKYSTASPAGVKTWSTELRGRNQGTWDQVLA